MDSVTNILPFDWLIIFKILSIFVWSVFWVASIIVIKQIRLMVKTVKGPANKLIFFIGFINLLIVTCGLLYSIFLL